MDQLKVALAGNPNCGKSTIFNALTGLKQKVGNYPGITVSKHEGQATINDTLLNICDLPGAYSLTPYSQEEIAARNHLINERPDVIINVVDSNSLERNLYFTLQLLELGIPLVLGLNMIDEVRKKGITIDSKKLSSLLRVPVLETVGKTGEGKTELITEAIRNAKEGKGVTVPLYISYGADLDLALQKMEDVIIKHNFMNGALPARWTAIKYLEGDSHVISMGLRERETHKQLEIIVAEVTDHCKKTLDTTPDEVIADYRYGYIASILNEGIISRNNRAERLELSDRIDKVLTNRLFGPIILLGVLYGMFVMTFTVGAIPMGWLETFFGFLGDTATNLIPEGLIQSLVVSGIIDGVGGVLGFVPLILFMFFMIAFLEDSGYMARVAYILDRIMQAAGLHGASVMPFVISGGIVGGCAVPGVMSTRTLKSPKEKLATILTLPFLTCGAKTPVVLLLGAASFPEYGPQVLFASVLLGWTVALVSARVLRSTVIKGDSTPFVMELPPYRLPTLKGLLIHTWERAWNYIQKAGTVILAISILLWAAMTFPQLPEAQVQEFQHQKVALEETLTDSLTAEEKAEIEQKMLTIDNNQAGTALRYSLAGKLGTALESVSSYAGFDWRVNIALIGGFAAKEVIVSSLGTAYSLGEVDAEASEALSDRLRADPNWTFLTAASLLVFVMLYAPCFITVVAIARETSWKWAGFSIVCNTIIAYVLAVGVYQIGSLILQIN
ncbi:MAG: ferrous iron transport protein B [SAR324 cluster bacterium]|nr:ferrous iron transport protein B [SAR324 cluster bacterium]